MLRGKKILLGVCGSIAAYKAAFLVRLLVKEGAEVQVILTPSAGNFITPMTLGTLSKKPVLTNFEKDASAGTWNNHVELGLWADLMVIAPASANTIGKMANGICDNLLIGTYLSARCPVMLAPAMDLDMLAHSSTQKNLDTLRSYGNIILDTGHGELASGLNGHGRMAEPDSILEEIRSHLVIDLPLRGKKALITAGPTNEPLDPVRYIGNHSTGKMGYSIAEELAAKGADVVLVSGPVSLKPRHNRIKLQRVVTAEEMYDACDPYFDNSDIVVFSAAVADYKPKTVSTEKIKKKGTEKLDLVQTHDIAGKLAERKTSQFIVGFALETEEAEKNAIRKLEKKKFDLIVLNSLRDDGAGFGHDTNKVTIIDEQNKKLKFELKSKKEVARDIVNEIISTIS